MTTLWTCDASKLPPHNGKPLRLPGPLFDLAGLQQLLSGGDLDLSKSEQLYFATDDSWKNLRSMKWTGAVHLRQALLLLKAGTRKATGGDYCNSQWAEDSEGEWWPCDSYRICINERDGFARARNAPETYIKFSIDEHGAFCLVVLSCHPST